MYTYTVERTIDNLGRIVLPREIQNKLGLRPGDVLSVSEENGVISITLPSRRCKLCGKAIPADKPLCADCVKEVKDWQ